MKILSDEEFLNLIRDTVLPSLDFIILSQDKSHILLGKRTNKPAQGFFFAPGGRIMSEQGETQDQACLRITQKELGIPFLLAEFTRIDKPYRHDYDDNVFGADGFGTHYQPTGLIKIVNMETIFTADQQHEKLVWMSVEDALTNPEVHPYTKAYIQDALNLLK